MADLKTLLETDARYDAVVQAGRNSECLALLKATKTGSTKVWNDIPVEDFLDVLGNTPLSTGAENRLRLIVSTGSMVPTSKAGVLAWVQGNINGPGVLTALANQFERESTWAEDAGVGEPSLNDVREAVRQIAKSFIVSSGQV